MILWIFDYMKVTLLQCDQMKNVRKVEELAHYLTKRGHAVQMIGWDRRNDGPYFFEHATIKRLHLSTPLGTHRYFMFLPFWWAWAFAQLVTSRTDLVISINTDTFIPSLLYSKLYSKRLVSVIDDYYYYIFRELGFHIADFIECLTRITIKNSHLHITVNEKELKTFSKRHEVDISQINYMLLPNMPSTREINNIKSYDDSKYDIFTVCYFGSLSKNRHLIQLIKAFEELPRCELLLAGKPLDVATMDQLLTAIQNQENIEYLGYLDREDLLQKTKKCHLIVQLLNTKKMNHVVAISTKLFDAIFCGTPIMTNAHTTTANMIQELAIGPVIKTPSSSDIQKGIENVLNNTKKWEKYRHNCLLAQERYKKEHKYETIVNRIESLL